MQRKTNLHHFQNKRFISYLSLLRKKDKVNLRRAWSNSCRSRLEMTIQWNLEHRNPASIDIPRCNDVRGIRNATLVRTELVVIHRRFGKNRLLDTIRTRWNKNGERKKERQHGSHDFETLPVINPSRSNDSQAQTIFIYVCFF